MRSTLYSILHIHQL